MRILFISSGNRNNSINPVVRNQGESIKAKNVVVEYFLIDRTGIKGYLSKIIELRRFLETHEYSLIHAHYSLSGFVAKFAGAKPLVVSLMGSDITYNKWLKLLAKLFSCYFWDKTIVKSEFLFHKLKYNKAIILPNGVNMNLFEPKDKLECQQRLNWDSTKKHVFFPASKERPEKNFKLAKKSISELSGFDIVIHDANKIQVEDMPIHYNAADVVLLTSFWEGSPNAIKEAMACNRPIVATMVGDVPKLFCDVRGCYLCEFTVDDVIKKLEIVLNNFGESTGRERLKGLKFDSNEITKKILQVYSGVISD